MLTPGPLLRVYALSGASNTCLWSLQGIHYEFMLSVGPLLRVYAHFGASIKSLSSLQGLSYMFMLFPGPVVRVYAPLGSLLRVYAPSREDNFYLNEFLVLGWVLTLTIVALLKYCALVSIGVCLRLRLSLIHQGPSLAHRFLRWWTLSQSCISFLWG